MTTKVCSKCGAEKGLGEFYKQKDCKYGRMAICKECLLAQQRAYREAHREECNAYFRAYREAHKEERLARARERTTLMGNPITEKWQEISKKYATRSGQWSEAEDKHLASSTGRVIDDALALQRTYLAVGNRLHRLRRQGITLNRDKQKETL